ncbi:activating signal cointegrator 1 complex subunit 2 [Anaeramoeba ignava]|uniref:Activating signal cointegrator 1 complex subunit 2 n=1 Tax=Anaeramoeba ignava TaxID=1746090 RepID=A0A9Q0RCC5_ANAIG|nr:activating signal cointegrator 1 complex subunit 2 [Anaeramoeba ignava]
MSNQRICLNKSFTVLQTESKTRKIPSLSPIWKEKIHFIKFLPEDNIPDEIQDQETEAPTSFEVLLTTHQDLRKLLRMDFQSFWNQVIYDKSLNELIDSYLQFRRRFFDQSKIIFSSTLSGIDEMIFKTIARLSHLQEHNSYLEENFYSKIIYEKQLFTIPKIFDICTLYSKTNFEVVSNVIRKIFDIQPKYIEDLKKAVSLSIEVIKKITETSDVIIGFQKSNKITHPKTADEEKENKRLMDISVKNFSTIVDLVSYILDISCSLSSFVSVVPNLSVYLFPLLPLISSKIYNQTIPEVTLNFTTDKTDFVSDIDISFMLKVSKKYLILLSRSVIMGSFESPQFNPKSVVDFFKSISSENNSNSIEDNDENNNEDLDQNPFINDLFSDNLFINRIRRKINFQNEFPEIHELIEEISVDLDDSSTIESIQTMFPNISTEDIQELLKQFDGNYEEVINFLLNKTTDNSPDDLSFQVLSSTTKTQSNFDEKSLLKEIFDKKDVDNKLRGFSQLQRFHSDHYDDEYDDTFDDI